MSGFFEAPPAPPEPRVPPTHAWLAPPENELGVPVALDVRLVRTDRIIVVLANVVAFSTGFAFEFVARRRDVAAGDRGMFDDIYRPGLSKPDALRFGMQYADGRKATAHRVPFDAPDATTEIVLAPGSGSTGPRTCDMHMWAWPLPSPGAVAFVCEWAAESIPLTRREVDAGPILDASRRTEQLWPEQTEEGRGAWTRVVGR